MSWFRNRTPFGPAVLVFQKVQSGQCPGVVTEGWEEEEINNYWSCKDKLYEKRGNDFVFIPTKKLSDFLREK